MNSKVVIGVLVVVIVLAGGAYWYATSYHGSEMQMSQSSAQQATNTTPVPGVNAVTIRNFAFSPNTISVKIGEKVTWTNQDSVGHSATADDKSWDTGVLAPGKAATVTFTKPGTYPYHCSVHPNMHGTVIVK